MNETGLDGSDFCNCGHDRERHSGGYGDCQIGDCNCRGFDDTLAEVKAEARNVTIDNTFCLKCGSFHGSRLCEAEARKAVELPRLRIEVEDMTAAQNCSRPKDDEPRAYSFPAYHCRERQLLAALTTIAALQYRVKELEAERDALKAADAWIDVRERLPDHHNTVQVWHVPTFEDGTGEDYSSPGHCGTAFWARTQGYGWTRGDGNRANDLFSTITHWRPLPSPPTQEAK